MDETPHKEITIMFLITGATGNVGRHVVDGLVEAGAPVRALTRDPGGARFPAGVEVAATEALPMDGVHTVFLHPAAVWAGPGPDGLLKKAVEHGVHRVVVLSSAAATDDDPANGIAARHRDLESAVEGTGLEWTFVRPGAFAVNTRQWAPQIRETGVVRAPYGRAYSTPIHERDIADVAVRAMTEDGLVGAAPVLSGPQALTQIEQLEIIGAAIGRSLRFEEISPEAARERMIGGFVTPQIADTLLRIFAEAVDRPGEVSPEVERITGRPGRTFEEWARDHADDFR